MNDNKLHPDEIAAYKYARDKASVNSETIRAFMFGCAYKNECSMKDRLGSVIESVQERMNHHAQVFRMKDVHEQEHQDHHSKLRDIKQELLMYQEILGNHENKYPR